MTRLTKHIREQMVLDLLKRKFQEEGTALATRSAELFDLLYNDFHDPKSRKLMADLKRIHRNAFNHYSYIKCNVNGRSLQVGTGRIGCDGIWFSPTIETRVFLENYHNSINFTYSDCEIGGQLFAYSDRLASFMNAIKAAKIEVEGALSYITTAKQLADQWPEAIPVLGRHIPLPQTSNVPAVQFAKLTQSFGLTATEAGA